jgi:hypothetical protein
MAEQKAADAVAAEQQKREAANAKTRSNAKQDTSKVAPVEFEGDPAKVAGRRPAAGTPPQVVEAAPGVELDTDLDRAALQRSESSAAVDVVPQSEDLLKRAQAKAPALTQEFVTQFGLTDDDLEEIASGAVPPPPTVGPVHNVDLHRTPGGWQVTAVGVAPEDAGKNAIHR